MKRTLAVMLSVMLMISAILIGCSKEKEKTEPTGSAAATGTASQSPSQSAASDGTKDGKYDPPITMTTVRQTNPTVKYASGDSVDNNPWTRLYADKYGIKIKTLWEVDPTQWEQKMNLTIASGDLPDFFSVTQPQLHQLRESDLIMDLTDVYNNHAPEQVKKLLTEGGDLALKSATFDGKLMAIPFTSPTKEGSSMVWVRTDWLQKLNLPEPNTMQDLLTISEAFATKDPDGNSKKDTFGLAVDKDLTLINGFLNGYHAYKTTMWVKDTSGKLVYGTIQPQTKTALQQLQQMFKGGQIDPEFGTKAMDKIAEDVASGKLGMIYASPYAGLWPLQGSVDKDPNANWKAYPIPSIDAEPAKTHVELGVASYWVVRKGVEHPEAILKMLDEFITLFYENKDEEIAAQYVDSKDGAPIWPMNSIAAYKAFKNVDQRIKVVEALKTGDTSNLTGDDKGVFGRIQKFQAGDRSLWGWDAIFNDNGSMKVGDYYRQNNLYQENQFYGAPLPAMVNKGPTLNKMELETLTKLIMGGASMDAFDKFVESWKKSGGDEITQQVNDWAAANK